VVLTNSANGQSIMPELVAERMPGMQPSFAWLSYEHFDTARRRHDGRPFGSGRRLIRGLFPRLLC